MVQVDFLSPSGSKTTVSIANPLPVSEQNVGSPTFFNVSVPTSGVEVGLAFPVNTRKFSFRNRSESVNLQFSFESGLSNIVFGTVLRRNSYWDDNVNLVVGSVFFRTDNTSQIIEVVTWS